MYTNWQLCTYIGLRAGQAIPDPTQWGLDFAMVVTFIGMLVPLILGRPILAAVLAAGIMSVIANPLPNRLGLILAPITGIVVGIVVETYFPGVPRPSPDRAVQESELEP
jgi:predicted branched-subunit amino acid permease